jgi:hypothetical protein
MTVFQLGASGSRGSLQPQQVPQQIPLLQTDSLLVVLDQGEDVEAGELFATGEES